MITGTTPVQYELLYSLKLNKTNHHANTCPHQSFAAALMEMSGPYNSSPRPEQHK